MSLLRYRFFLHAGGLPYLLGATVAYDVTGSFELYPFFLGLFGLVLSFTGVEAFNEYFEPDKGFFSPSPKEGSSNWVFLLGVFALAGAFAVAIHLAFIIGPLVLLLAALGGLAAAFYVGPPLRLAYRGLGELSIFASYGPLITLGGYYLQTAEVALAPILASLAPGMLILALALVNEIPDYYQDMVMGKRNMVVRIGRRKAVALYQTLLYAFFTFIILGIAFRKLPLASLSILILAPLAYKNISIAKGNFKHPQNFIPAIRGTISLYTIAMGLLIISYLI